MLVNIREAEALASRSVVPLSYATQVVGGEKYTEPFHDYNGEGSPEYYGFDNEPREPTDEEFDEFQDGNYLYNVSPHEFVETAINIGDEGKTVKFSFEERPYLIRIYNTGSRKSLLKCGRQTEKCGRFQLLSILKASGQLVSVKDLKVGDEVISLRTSGDNRFGPELGTGPEPVQTDWRLTRDVVTRIKNVGKRRSLRIRTRMGSELEVGEDHPILSHWGWTCAGEIEVGDRVSAVRGIDGCAKFGNGSGLRNGEVPLYGYYLADGTSRSGMFQITKTYARIRKKIEHLLDSSGNRYSTNESRVNISRSSNLSRLIKSDGLWGKYSSEKFIPDWIFEKCTRNETIEFIKSLWVDCDSSAIYTTQEKGSDQWDIVYGSTSKRLAKQVRALLWKFGIPSRFRSGNHGFYENDENKDNYLVRVETEEGVKKFLSLFTDFEFVDDKKSNSNRDTFPLSIVQPLIDGMCRKCGIGDKRGRGEYDSLRKNGFRRKLRHPPNRQTIKRYLDFFESRIDTDDYLYTSLRNLYFSDIIWDEIVEIEDLGENDVYHVETERFHNYCIDGIITHNSTSLGNKIISYSCLNNHFRSLYVSSSAEQAKVFSNDRISEPIALSPTVKAYTNSVLTNAVFHKKFINYSQIRIRYAYLNADRVRGIPADLISIDEIQDIIVDNIPVIEECASHSPFKIFIYSGTPKSLDNTIEYYWSNFSTQNEWVVPCEHHGTPKDKSSWYWNILGERNIGLKGVICEKCGNLIDPAHPSAQWASLNPVTEANKERVTFDGYRISQLMVPWILKKETAWLELRSKYERYSRQKFINEVLGMSYDSGIRPINRTQVEACCQPVYYLADYEHLRTIVQGKPVFAGIDWGCHDEETRILTDIGWKFFKELTDEDKVAQWDPDTREMSFVKPVVRTVRKWRDPLYHFETKGGMDLMVTGTHRMRVRGVKSGNWVTESADKTAERGGNVKFVGYVCWKGEERKSFELPGLPKSSGYGGCESKTFDMDDWLEFLGYYLSEGGVCLRTSKSDKSKRVPYAVKMSQRESSSPENVDKIRLCMIRSDIPFSEFLNRDTSDINWSIKGKQYWKWFFENVGESTELKRIPREFLRLSKRQLRILFKSMMLGDGSEDKRDKNFNGYYSSTSKGLCEDFQEICIKLGLRCSVSLHKHASGNRKAIWRAMWSRGRDFHFNTPAKKIKRVPYSGKVYCCKVPSGYIVTERNGKVAYQGNTGENSYTVISLGCYMGDGNFTIFWIHRFTGEDLDPEIQIRRVSEIITHFNVSIVGCDYGGGFDKNARLIREFGPNRVFKFQYNPDQKKGKVYWDEGLMRFAVHRTEVMTDIFQAMIRKDIRVPNWNDFADPYGKDILNIFSEEVEVRGKKMTVYRHSPGNTDDSFHSILYCMLASMIKYPRPDIIVPRKETA